MAIANPSNFVEQFQNFIEHVAGEMKKLKTVPFTGATSSAAGKAGLVPQPVAANINQYLRGDGAWATPPNDTYGTFTGASSNGAGGNGLVPAPGMGQQNRFLRGDATWQVIDTSSAGVPTGSLVPFAGTTVPSGYLLCNGANISRTTYSKLFGVIGTKYGAGNGSTTFGLPNFNNRFIEGTTDTSKVGTYLEAGLPNITGSFYSSGDFVVNTLQVSGAFIKGTNKARPDSRSLEVHNMPILGFNAATSNAVFGSSNSIQMPAIYTLIIIKE